MPDLPSSPRKTVSSASVAARSQPQKKPGAPKPKGAVRAKSGCYTCRIRRKKCDEQPNPDGACQTCVRLRLQCLGFGAKRPDWMRENNSVTELREKIKTFLASQGMIKGHSGSGPRSNDGDPPMLVLVENLQNPSPSSSPPTPPLSATSSDGHRPPGLMTSYVRDGGSHYPPMQPPEQHYAPASWQSSIPDLAQAHHDPGMARGNPILPNVNDMMYHHPHHMLPSPSSLVPLPSPSWQLNGTSSFTTTLLAPTTYDNLGGPSSFSSTYNTSYIGENDNDSAEDISERGGPTYYMANSGPPDLVFHYLQNVLPIQYLLADSSISNCMLNLIRTSVEARDAACILAAIHMRAAFPHTSHPPVSNIVARLRDSLMRRDRPYTEGHAMAGLHLVSNYLFSGGRGQWDFCLKVASDFVHGLLCSPKYCSPEDLLQKCTESTRFIIKTTMWFDVLASVTTQQIPRFLTYYRQLFAPKAYIDDPTDTKTSMLQVMGCENKVVLAIAEISNLAHWKAVQQKRGTLSMPQLVARGTNIEESYLLPSSPLHRTYDLGGYGHGVEPYGHTAATDGDIATRRKFTNDIFRTSARVYLHTVLSGDYPSCPEIAKAVQDTMECLRRIPPNMPDVQRGVVRSVVFGICISGCLTDDSGHRDFLRNLLTTRESLGNLSEVKNCMEEVWAKRDAGEPVDWRLVMQRSTEEMLLLV